MGNDRMPVAEAVASIYEEIDEVAAAQAKRLGATCRKGCAHCCMQLTSITVPEALLIAERVATMKLEDILPKLREAALAHDYDGINNQNYFDKMRACAFLRLEDKTCGIYDVRPTACRLHFVVSDPGLCDPKIGNAQTKIINMEALEVHIWKFAATIQKELGMGDIPIMGPIPLMVLWALNEILEKEPERQKLVQTSLTGIPSPVEWLIKHLGSITVKGA